MNAFSKSEAIKFGWQKMKENFWFFVIVLIVVAAIQFLPNMFGGFQGQNGSQTGLLVVIISILAFVIKMVIDMGLLKIALNIHDNKKPDYSELYKNYPLFLKYFIASLLYGLAVGIGFILLIVPGIIFALKLQYYGFLIVDKGMGPIAALKKSWEMTKGVKWNLFLLGLLLGLINVAGAIVLLIGLFATIPTTLVANAYVYRKLLNHAS